MERHMKKQLSTVSMIALLTGAVLMTPSAVHANNSHIEAAMQSFGDLSMFYQALLNTGVINELREDQHYTVFAPTNEAFVAIQPANYPCFYAVQCRPQIAAILRDHIIVGEHGLKDLVSYGRPLATMGPRKVYVDEPYVGKYAVDNNTILSKTEVDGNIVYRIDGVIALPQELATFQTVTYTPSSVVTKKTVTTYTTQQPVQEAYPSGGMVDEPAEGDSVTEKTTVIRTYTTEQ
jgi:uncharacterized surface protein with fasciclin (FAS1) repeats